MAEDKGYKKLDTATRFELEPGASDAARSRVDSEIDAEEFKRQFQSTILSDDDSKKVLYPTPADTWGVMMYVIVKDLGEMADGEFTSARVVRVAYASVIMAINLVLQFMILWWVFEYVVIPSEASLQKHYALFHRDCFDVGGSFNAKKWATFDAEIKQSLCQVALSQPSFMAAILFLWTLAMLSEFHENLRLHRHIMQMTVLPRSIKHGHQVIESETGEMTAFLVALSWKSRALLYVLIVIPKYMIIFVLTFIGWTWLSSSESFADLILNSLALGFVVTIDDLMFVSLFPEKVTERVSSLKLAVPANTYDSDDEKIKAQDADVQKSICRSLTLVVSAMVVLAMFIRWQTVLPGYEHELGHLCSNRLQELPCSVGTYLRHGCFPKGPAEAEI